MTCAEIAEDSSVLAVGFSDSVIKVWSLVSQKLRTMKSAEILQEIDIEASQSNCSSIVLSENKGCLTKFTLAVVLPLQFF